MKLKHLSELKQEMTDWANYLQLWAKRKSSHGNQEFMKAEVLRKAVKDLEIL